MAEINDSVDLHDLGIVVDDILGKGTRENHDNGEVRVFKGKESA